MSGSMLPIELLRPPGRCPLVRAEPEMLHCYLLAAVIVLAVRAVQLALGLRLTELPGPPPY